MAIVFFTNIVLSLAALIYIVTGINTDLFVWVKDYVVSLKDDDSAVNAKVIGLASMIEARILCKSGTYPRHSHQDFVQASCHFGTHSVHPNFGRLEAEVSTAHGRGPWLTVRLLMQMIDSANYMGVNVMVPVMQKLR